MARRKQRNPDKRESEVVQAAYELALERIKSGKASDALITYLLKQEGKTATAARNRMVAQTNLYDIKAEAVVQDSRSAELFEEAIAAMKIYSGAQNSGGIDDEVL